MQSKNKQLLDRKTYKTIKKYNRAEMEVFTRNLYEQGFKEGFQEGIKSNNAIDFKIELVQLLDSIEGKGIGPKTKATILKALKERED